MLEVRGKQIGSWLLKRHKIIENFMRIIGVNDAMVLQETEKIEHTLSNDTAICFESFVTFMLNNPDIINRYAVFRANHL